MSYSKTFYTQSNVNASITYGANAESLFVFGISGSGEDLMFSGINGMLFDYTGRFIGPCSSSPNFLEIYSESGNASVFVNGRLVDNRSLGYTYSSVYADCANPYTFDFNIFGEKPLISGGVATIGNDGMGTGDITFYGDYPINVSSFDLDNKMDWTLVDYPDIIDTGVNNYTFSGSGYYPSGSFMITTKTDAGSFDLLCFVKKEFVPQAGDINLWVDSDITGKNSTINFYIQNTSGTDQDVDLYLTFGTGAVDGLYPVTATGYGYMGAAFSYSGSRIIGGIFTGDVTGQGGRSGSQEIFSGLEQYRNHEFVPTGFEGRTLSIPASGIVDENLFYGDILVYKEATSENGLFKYIYTGQTGVPSSAIIAGGGTGITPLPTDTFTGSIRASYPVTGQFSGNLISILSSGTTVNEGTTNFYETWNVIYDGSDYVASGWTGNNTIGTGAPQITIPANSTVSGQITFVTDFSGSYFHEATLSAETSSLTLSKYV